MTGADSAPDALIDSRDLELYSVGRGAWTVHGCDGCCR